MAVTVSDCEANQAAWNAAVAVAGGGRVWQTGELRWSWQEHDRQLMLNFPRVVDAAGAEAGIAFAREHGACIVGAWLAPGVDASPLESVGFERGWEPWWISGCSRSLRAPGGCAWHVVARLDDRLAGRAWTFVTGAVAGVYDMEVWPRFRRQGLGRGLLRVVCAAARASGAQTAVLNATPDGEQLYSTEGFTRIGTGITYWHHLA